MCDPGTTGNPYRGCEILEKSDCLRAHCGIDAQCSSGPNALECVCPAGYSGNPYIQCYGKPNKCAFNQMLLNNNLTNDLKVFEINRVKLIF